MLSAEALRRGRGVVFLVFTGVFLRVWEGVFLRSLRTMRPPMLLRRRPARCGVVFVAAGMVCRVLAVPACRVSRRGAAQSSSWLSGFFAFAQSRAPIGGEIRAPIVPCDAEALRRATSEQRYGHSREQGPKTARGSSYLATNLLEIKLAKVASAPQTSLSRRRRRADAPKAPFGEKKYASNCDTQPPRRVAARRPSSKQSNCARDAPVRVVYEKAAGRRRPWEETTGIRKGGRLH